MEEVSVAISFLKRFALAIMIAFPICLVGVILIFVLNALWMGNIAEIFDLVKKGWLLILRQAILWSATASLVNILSFWRMKSSKR